MPRPAFGLLSSACLKPFRAGDPDVLLTKLETAAYYRVSVDTLDRWRRRGLGPLPVKLPGGDLRYRLSDVRAVAGGDGAAP